ncbi:ceramide glucosyltransferase [Paracoccaceae bacterium Fryx2]|nr:ceramide glucosyltransferase [Paracoccaceae bacterium Fryx2]
MAAGPVLLAVAVFCALALALHVATILAVLWRRDRPGGRMPVPPPLVCLLRPVCGVDAFEEETLASSFRLTYPDLDIVFCAASADDPVVPLVRRLIAAHPRCNARLLIGEDAISGNPKLNNLSKGWNGTGAEWIAMADSNVLLPPDYIETLLACWTPGTGLVTAPPEGVQAEGFWAAVECAFLNTYQARWQLAADQCGLGFAQGKTLFWHRKVLEDAGGLAALGRNMAEDVAATRIVRGQGLKVRLMPRPVPHPIGRRTLTEVWDRQLRWSRVRREGFFWLFVPELLNGGAFPALGAAVLALSGAVPVAAALGFVALWYGIEALLAARRGWRAAPVDVLAWAVRDLMLAPLWIATFARRGFVWRGTPIASDSAAHGATAE